MFGTRSKTKKNFNLFSENATVGFFYKSKNHPTPVITSVGWVPDWNPSLWIGTGPGIKKPTQTKAHFTLGVEPKVVLKSSIPIGAITEMSPRALH